MQKLRIHPSSKALGAFLWLSLALSTVALGKTNHRNKLGTPPDEKPANLPSSPSPVPVPAPTGHIVDNSPPPLPSAPATAKTKAQSEACAKKDPIEAFNQATSYGFPQASSLGGVYYLTQSVAPTQLLFSAAAESEPRPLTTFEEGVQEFRVSPNGQWVAVITSADHNRLALYDVEHQAWQFPRQNIPEHVESLAWSSDSRWLAFTTNARNGKDFDLLTFTLANKNIATVAPLTGVVRIDDIAPDAKHVVLTRMAGHREVATLNLETKALNVLASSPSANTFHGQFTADSKHLLYLTDADGPTRLRRLAIAEPAASLPLTEEDRDIDQYVLDNRRQSLGIVLNLDGYSKVAAFEIDSSGRKGNLIPPPTSQGLEGLVIDGISFGFPSGIFYAPNSTRVPGEVRHSQFPKDILWAAPKRTFHIECTTNEKLLHYPSFDQKSVAAFYYEIDDQNAPLVLYAHDGPESQFRPRFLPFVHYLTQRGFRLFAPNPRGSAGYGRTFAEADNGPARPDAVKDLLAGAHWLLEKSLVRRGTMGAYGLGYGGLLVRSALLREPKLFVAGAQIGKDPELEDWLANFPKYQSEILGHEFGSPETITALPLGRRLGKLKTPYLITPLTKTIGPLEATRAVLYFIEPHIVKR
jgi:hypothetical protein